MLTGPELAIGDTSGCVGLCTACFPLPGQYEAVHRPNTARSTNFSANCKAAFQYACQVAHKVQADFLQYDHHSLFQALL